MSAILVVDDEKHQRLLLREEFQQEGHTVLTASNGEEALSALTRAMPHIVVLDIGLSGMDGIELLGKLLTINNRLPVVIYTGFASYLDNWMSWAANAYILKSSDLTELKQTIRGILDMTPAAARQQRGWPRWAMDGQAPLVPQQFRDRAGIPLPRMSTCKLLTHTAQAMLPAPAACRPSMLPLIRAKELLWASGARAIDAFGEPGGPPEAKWECMMGSVR